MANAMYDKGRQAFLEGSIAFISDDIKAVLINTSLYTVNLSTNQFLSDIAVGARVATSGNLSSKTSTAGVANCDNVTFSSVTGAACSAIAFYKDTGSASTSPLIAYEDTATGLPVTPNGADITVVIDTGSNKLFKL